MHRLTVAVASFFALAAPLTAETAAELVARSIAHHGGQLYESTRITLDLCSKSGCSELAVRQDGGVYEYCAAADVKAGRRKVCIDNDAAREWLDGVGVTGASIPGSETAIARDAALRDWVMERVYFAFLPYRLEDPSVRLEDLGFEAWDGRELRKVEVSFDAGSSTDADDEFLFWFDPESARLELFVYSYERNEGGLRFRRLKNYRRVGGILFFDQENFGVEGRDLSVELVSPAYLEGSMRHVSTVELRDLVVVPLE